MEPTLIVHFRLIGIDRLYSLVLSDAKVAKLIVKVWETEWKTSWKDLKKSRRRKSGRGISATDGASG